MEIWVKQEGRAHGCPLAVQPCSVTPTHIDWNWVTVTGLPMAASVGGTTVTEDARRPDRSWAAIWRLSHCQN